MFELFGDQEGWILTILSSVMCICGASIIYLDVLIKLFNPNSSFNIKSNQNFLIMGFSLSCGSLIYTSLYKLLPKASKYFHKVNERPSLLILIFFNCGVLVCFGLNYIIHYFASQSIVHCNHGGDEEMGHSHTHSQGSEHSHSHAEETTPLLRPDIRKKSSFFQFLTDSDKCVCLTEQDCKGHPCISKKFTDKISNDITNLEIYRDDGLVAYTDEHEDEQLRLTHEPNLQLHERHKDDHQHQINTPLSKILSLGLQTSFALTLHKLPEGFITYATSRADPKAGLTIFLSLAIHNFMEGFSMVLPLYLALNSRLKAFSITFVLGGFSQPFGALLAYYLLQGKEINTDETNFIFGILISITCGFLAIISLQLFASAINFGGSVNKVLIWCVFGIFIIQLSTVLTDL